MMGTPRSQATSKMMPAALNGKEPQVWEGAPPPQSLLGGQLSVPVPADHDMSQRSRSNDAKRALPTKNIHVGESQRGNSPHRRRRQYARSDSSSDDEHGDDKRFTPISSARSESSKQYEATDATADVKTRNIRSNANAILNDSDSDEEVRVRASDLPVRRLVNQRFQK